MSYKIGDEVIITIYPYAVPTVRLGVIMGEVSENKITQFQVKVENANIPIFYRYRSELKPATEINKALYL